jgi:membrane carboxypeptidase/penicillin-binding protein
MVTTLQLAMAMGAIANGSKLLEPILVKKVTDSQGEVVREASVHVRREVAPPAVARMVAQMLVAVTEDGGTAVEAVRPGLPCGGEDVDGPESGPDDRQVLSGQIHGRFRRVRAGRSTAHRGRRRARRALDRKIRRRLGRPGLSSRGRSDACGISG